ncbi:MAG: type ISP restriction/modification enzyme [Melioribacteraceae bacterium]
MISSYLKKLRDQYSTDDSTENSFYKFLDHLLVQYSEDRRKKKIHVTILPKQTEAGNPDFKITDGHHRIIGYIEAKTIGVDLDKIEDSEQLQRYIKTFPNVILTNFTDFRFYRDGKLFDKISIARSMVIKKLGTIPAVENEEKFFLLLERFLSYSIPKSFTAKTLATELAKRTRFLKDQVIAEELRNGDKNLIGFHNAFKEFLIAGIDEEEFADLYAQTITYGLFAARLRADKTFNRRLAFDYIPKTIGILRDIFRFISSSDLPEQMQSIVDDIADILDVADTKKILEEYFVQGKGSDPVLHFYETFLEVYDPATREKRGVYYTPEPVVSFIVRSLHIILKEKFGMDNGLGNKDVTLLDPAGGTLSFLAAAIQLIVKEMEERFGRSIVRPFIKENILENYYAFELMMAPYAIGHMKMAFLLEELGYKMNDNERVKYYLTNTLDMQELEESKFPTMSSLSHESHEAGKIKKQEPILVILGNPPYSGHSSNTGDWISKEIKAYHEVDGKPLGEKNPKWLQDDYVKFIRFAQWKIDQAGSGVIGFITNHSYLDNPTFRGMRQSLMNSFDEIYILDLHGNSLKKEKAPDGSKDENVFDIQQGVAIAFFIKNKKEYKSNKVFHSEIYGLREKKYNWLFKNDINTVKWKKAVPIPQFYLFQPTNNKLLEHYGSFAKITEILPESNNGLFTARDELTIHYNLESAWNTTKTFARLDVELARQTYHLRKDVRDWKIEYAQADLKESGLEKENIKSILYRPFDIRFTYYTGKSRGFHCMPRREIMRHMLNKNIALCVGRQASAIGSDNYDIVFISENIVDLNLFRRGGELVFPLYIYPAPEQKKKGSFTQMIIFEPEVKYGGKEPNISPEIFELLRKNFKRGSTPEQIFYYIYAILFSNTYRKKYAEFLKIDFPRVPFTKDYKLFIKLGKLGEHLAELHLLKSKDLEKQIRKLNGDGANKIEKLSYENEKVWINTEQYFNNIKEEVWKYQIGGYQVCDKWLKDRKGRVLSSEEIQIYCKIITALSKTIEIQKEIDELYSGVE